MKWQRVILWENSCLLVTPENDDEVQWIEKADCSEIGRAHV